MMTMRTDLEAPLRAPIDDRLDAIDRVLLRAGVSRGERRSIVEEVENQVYELLARRADGEPTRADVEAVLASLDPPEEYAPEEYRHRLAERPAPETRLRLPQPCLLAIGSAAGAAFTLLFLFFLLAGLGGEAALLGAFLLFPAAAGVTAGGILSIRRIRQSRGWLYGLPLALFAAALFPFLLANGLLALGVMMTGEIGLVAIPGLTVLAANIYVGYRLWHWVSAGYHRANPVAEHNH
jgi:hypothetical protein